MLRPNNLLYPSLRRSFLFLHFRGRGGFVCGELSIADVLVLLVDRLLLLVEIVPRQQSLPRHFDFAPVIVPLDFGQMFSLHLAAHLCSTGAVYEIFV